MSKDGIVAMSERERLEIIINDILQNPQHPYWQAHDRNHRAAVEEMRDLFIRLDELSPKPPHLEWKETVITGLHQRFRE